MPKLRPAGEPRLKSPVRGIVITHDTAEPDWQHWAKRIHGSWQKAVESIIETGRLLIEAKAELNHGEFIRMVDSHLPFGPRTAQMLMAIAEHPVISNANHWFAFPPSWRTLSELAKLPPNLLEAKIADGTINPRMERKDVARLVKKPGDAAAKHKAKVMPLQRLRDEIDEKDGKIADLEERVASAESVQTLPLLDIVVRETAEGMATTLVPLEFEEAVTALEGAIRKVERGCTLVVEMDRNWRKAIEEVGQERLSNLVSKLKAVLDDIAVQAADRAEAKAKAKQR